MFKYNLHDSLIEKVDYSADCKDIIVRIQLCNWKQSNYVESDPEMLSLCMIFHEVEKYELSIDGYKFCSNEILDVIEVGDHTLKIVFLTEDNVATIEIRAKRVSYDLISN